MSKTRQIPSAIASIISRSTNATSSLQLKRPEALTAILPSTPSKVNRSSMAVKSWRASLFPVTAPASRREVELLSEWLNSVLAENLEANSNPLDVCTNAQHWFSVAFNELVRQVSVTCAERGRLFAIIWKRNQQLLLQLVQIQKTERQYILKCHKDRMQFLKSDLEFTQQRLQTVSSAYNDEKSRWDSFSMKDATKFDNLQSKINEHIEGRKPLISELEALRKQMGVKNLPEENIEEEAHSFAVDDLSARSQSLRHRTHSIQPSEIQDYFDDVQHFLELKQTSRQSTKLMFEKYLLSLPSDAPPRIRSLQWLLSLISYIFGSYMISLASIGPKRMRKKPLIEFIFEQLLDLFGSRQIVEQTLLDIFSTIREYMDDSPSRVSMFARFLGMSDPLPIDCFFFYLYTLTSFNRDHSGPLFPEVEAVDTIASGIPISIASAACQKILSKFSEGRNLKYYLERVNKIASDGYIRFGGKNFAEIDSMAEYMTSVFADECGKIEDGLKGVFDSLPLHRISTFTQFYNVIAELKVKPSTRNFISREFRMMNSEQGIDYNFFIDILRESGLNTPFTFESSDFLNVQCPDDVVKYLQNEMSFDQSAIEEVTARAERKGNEFLTKQMKASKAKVDQTMSTRSVGRAFLTIHRECYERLTLTDLLLKEL